MGGREMRGKGGHPSGVYLCAVVRLYMVLVRGAWWAGVIGQIAIKKVKEVFVDLVDAKRILREVGVARTNGSNRCGSRRKPSIQRPFTH